MRLLLVLFYIIFISFTCSAQDLLSVLSSTYESNSSIKSARERLKETDEQIMQSLSRWLPSVSATTQKRFLKQGGSPSSPASNETDGISRDLNIIQNLFKGGADVASMKMAKAAILQERSNLVAKEQEVLQKAVEVYMKTLQAEEEYKILEEQLEDAKVLVQFATKRFAVGEGTKTDVAQARSSLAEVNSALIAASSNLEILKANFYSITGMEAYKLIEPNMKLSIPQTLDQALEYANINNPHLLAARHASTHHEYNVDKVRGEKILPSVNLKHMIQDNRRDGNRGVSGLRSGALSNVTVLSMEIPIFDGGAAWSQYRQAKRSAKRSKYETGSAYKDVMNYTTAAWREYESKKYILESKKEEVNSARIAYKGMKKEERAGLRSINDVIVARNNYFSAYRRMLNAKTDYEVSRYAIAAQVGTCTAEHLKLNVKLYDPLKNYNIIKLQLVGSYNPD